MLSGSDDPTALSNYIQMEALDYVAAFSNKKRQLCFSFLHSKIAVKNEH